MKKLILKIATIATLACSPIYAGALDLLGSGQPSFSNTTDAVLSLEANLISYLTGDILSFIGTQGTVTGHSQTKTTTGGGPNLVHVTNVGSTIKDRIDNINSTLVYLYNKLFFGEPGDKTPRDLDGIIADWSKNFYSTSNTNGISSDYTSLNKSKSTLDKNLTTQIGKSIGYASQTELNNMAKDHFAVLSNTAFEPNNAQYLGSRSTPKASDNPYLDQGESVEAIDSPLSIRALLGESYYETDASKNKAKAFISQIEDALPPPKNFYIPNPSESKSSGLGLGGLMSSNQQNTTLYLPEPSTDSRTNTSTPYTSVDYSNDELKALTPWLSDNSKAPLYGEYKTIYRGSLALRSLYLDTLLRSYLSRVGTTQSDKNGNPVKDSSSGNKYNQDSTAALEKAMAEDGMQQSYYDNLAKKSVTEVNLESLHTMNKLVYFLYQLHKDNENIMLQVALAGLLNQAGVAQQNEQKYIQPITKLIQYKCMLSDQQVEKLNVSDEWKKTRSQICANPQAPIMPTSGSRQ
jgi:hypothetical protein